MKLINHSFTQQGNHNLPKRKFYCTKIIFASLFFILICISCKKESEELQIIIENRTEYIIHVNLNKGGVLGLYLASDLGGVHYESIFNLSPNEYKTLYTTGNLTIKPYELSAKIFNYIDISAIDNDVIIKFTHDTVTGYSENIFSENSTWDFKIEKSNRNTQFSKNPVKTHCYRFLISEENFVVPKD